MTIKRKKYNISEAKIQLLELVEKANQGIDIILMKEDEPVAKIVPYKIPQRRRLGFAKSIRILERFNEIPEGFEK